MRLKTIILAAILAAVAYGQCIAAASLFTWSGHSGFRQCTMSHARYNRATGNVEFDAKAPIRPGEDADVAVVETPEVIPAKQFNEAVPSWDCYTPDGGYVIVDMKARVDGKWTGWYRVLLYSTTDKPEPRKSFNDRDDIAAASVETLQIKHGKTADAVKLRFELRSTDGKNYPTLRFVALNTNDPVAWIDFPEPVKSVWGKELDVPYLCQLSVPGGSVWCSPTSTAMVCNYWANKLKRPEMTWGITESANACMDHRWGGTGNWAFNTAHAGEFKGMRAFLDRFTSITQIEQWIAKGVPVVVSVDYTRLNRRNSDNVVGHLMVIRGFTKDGDPVFNDPWAHLEKGEKLRKVFPRANLEYGWLGPGGSYGTVYIIYPEQLNIDY